MRLGHRVKKFLSNETYVDLMGALAAGLFIGVFVSVVRSMGGPPVAGRVWVESILLAVASYLAVAALLQRYWTGLLNRILPKWILTAALGSMLMIGIISIPAALGTWGGSYQMEKTLSEFISVRLEDARSATIVFCFISLPILAVFHYAGAIFQGIRRWHNEPGAPTSITNNAALKK